MHCSSRFEGWKCGSGFRGLRSRNSDTVRFRDLGLTGLGLAGLFKEFRGLACPSAGCRFGNKTRLVQGWFANRLVALCEAISGVSHDIQ